MDTKKFLGAWHAWPVCPCEKQALHKGSTDKRVPKGVALEKVSGKSNEKRITLFLHYMTNQSLLFYDCCEIVRTYPIVAVLLVLPQDEPESEPDAVGTHVRIWTEIQQVGCPLGHPAADEIEISFIYIMR